MKESKYAKLLAKIQVAEIFLKQDMWRNVLPKFIEICMETPCFMQGPILSENLYEY